MGAADPNLQFLATQGITLTNYFAVTHPSEPNYVAAVGGDHFGMDGDDFIRIPSNVSTIVDLLDIKSISWAEYQEGLPYAGFQGFNYSNQVNFANDYVRKHNPLVIFDSITNNPTRLELIKNFTAFNADLAAQTLPQWSFITPNMTNDGHDTNVTFAGNWARTFLTPLLNNSYFMNNTLVVLTFDEDETYTSPNKMFTVLLGGAIPTSLHGTTDSTFYNHYSMISTVSANWGLPSLGRWDCGANILQLVANKTNYVNSVVNLTALYFNTSYPGPLSDSKFVPVWPVPDTLATCASGKGVLGSIVSTWGNSSGTYNYTAAYPYDNASGNNLGGSFTPSNASSVTTTTTTNTSSTTTSPAASSSTGAATSNGVAGAVILGMVGAWVLRLVL